MREKDLIFLAVVAAVAFVLWRWQRTQRPIPLSMPPIGVGPSPPPLPPPAVGKPGDQLTGAPPPASVSSKLDKVQGYFQVGAQALLQKYGVPGSIAAPIAKYGNTVAQARYVANGAEVGAKAVGSGVATGAKAVGHFFSSLF